MRHYHLALLFSLLKDNPPTRPALTVAGFLVWIPDDIFCFDNEYTKLKVSTQGLYSDGARMKRNAAERKAAW